ncbi:hypothetical protein BCY88_29445 [Paraburkholderia fungorum]|uniref:Uncharacterized protein n=1 Tax=Paraburkholderia fungorum TaxID=134537 RepID=A0A420GGK5_9BURK|nr:hypothetical protein BCY88_29445 [Paraburkholderia fungorum]
MSRVMPLQATHGVTMERGSDTHQPSILCAGPVRDGQNIAGLESEVAWQTVQVALKIRCPATPMQFQSCIQGELVKR